MELTMSQRARYARNIAVSEIGEEGQQKLLKSSVLIFGAGGLGSPAALYLAAAGVGTIGIVDSDSVDLSNLQRQIIHRMSSLSRPKTRSAAEALSALNPFVRTVLYQKRADGDSITDILRDRPWDFILDCTDNYPTKFLINDACVREKKPFCHAGFLRFAGQAMTYVPGKGPCLRCLFGGVQPGEVRRSRGSLRDIRLNRGSRGHQVHNRERRAPYRKAPYGRRAHHDVQEDRRSPRSGLPCLRRPAGIEGERLRCRSSPRASRGRQAHREGEPPRQTSKSPRLPKSRGISQ